MWSQRPFTFDRVVRIFFTVVVFCIVLYFLYLLRHVLLPFFVACLIAYCIEPWVKWNQKKLGIKRHAGAVLLTTLEAAIIFTLLCIVLIPIVDNELSQLSNILDQYAKNGHSVLNVFQTNIHNFIVSHLDMDKIIEGVDKINISEALEEIWKNLTSGLDKILGVLGWLVSLVYVIFILLDFDKYRNGLKKYIPEKYKQTVAIIANDTSWTMKKYFRNQAFIAVIVGICYSLGFTIVGIPMAIVIGLLNMVLYMIPYMVYISLIPVTIMCVFKSMETGMDFWIIWMECLAVYAVVQVLSDLILTPHIMGKALGMNPALILLSLSVWGTLLGLLGMVIALPATTIIIKWIKIWLGNWRDTVDSSSSETGDP